MPNGFRARLNFGLVEDLNEFYRNVRGIIGKHRETIVITFQPVTFIIIIPLFRHANFWLLLTAAAVEKPHTVQQVFTAPPQPATLRPPPLFHILMRFHLCCWALDVWYVLVTGNVWVVCTPFRGGPVRANLLVRVDCQAYRPTHFTIWLYSYARSGTLTVSAHKNTTLTPTTPDESSQSCKPVQEWERNKNDPFRFETLHLQPTSPEDYNFNLPETHACLSYALFPLLLFFLTGNTSDCLLRNLWQFSACFDSTIQWNPGKLPVGYLDNEKQ